MVGISRIQVDQMRLFGNVLHKSTVRGKADPGFDANILILYLGMQKYIVSGITAGAVKG